MRPAAFSASLVNLKNAPARKSVALTLFVPEDQARALISALGWPTMGAPIPVAIAGLQEAAEGHEHSQPASDPWNDRHWSDLSPAQQTGVIRNEPRFWRFAGVTDAEGARDHIRAYCGVKSCADILRGTEAAWRWAHLQVRYGDFLRQRTDTA